MRGAPGLTTRSFIVSDCFSMPSVAFVHSVYGSTTFYELDAT